jgi:ribonucleotide monophosphatase NagD (HAD superfamily)
MIGDRVSSDIAGGRAAGLETVLVLSGTTSGEEAAAADPAPDHVVGDLAALLK